MFYRLLSGSFNGCSFLTEETFLDYQEEVSEQIMKLLIDRIDSLTSKELFELASKYEFYDLVNKSLKDGSTTREIHDRLIQMAQSEDGQSVLKDRLKDIDPDYLLGLPSLEYEECNSPRTISREEAECILKQKFGLDHFKDQQWQGISEILKGNRVLMIHPTGFGKSICFQFPAIMFDGLTLVFSPLKALMKDQIDHLTEAGISAGFLNTSIEDPEERKQILQDAIDGKYKMLYIAPERMENEDWRNAIQKMNISFIVIDEAHCISSWGHVFRPSYRRIVNLVKLLPKNCPVMAVTATANKRTQQDIETQIGNNVVTLRGDLTRKNIQLRVCRVSSKDQLYIALIQYLRTVEGSGIIYAGSTMGAEILAKWLTFMDIPSISFYGRKNEQEKNEILEGLKTDRWKCIVSTSALGMGIDKPDIAFIIHTQIPESPIHYYQEIGRAGRNGRPSQAMLFYNEDLNDNDIPEGKSLSLSFVQNARPEPWKYEKVIDELKKERNTKYNLSVLLDFPINAVETILEDLIDQRIVTSAWKTEDKQHNYYCLPESSRYLDATELISTEEKDALKNYLLHNRKASLYILRQICSLSNQIVTSLVQEGAIIERVETETKRTQFYEYLPNAPELSTINFDGQKRDAMADLRKMEEYVFTKEPRMGFLCHYLDSWENPHHCNCDNTDAPKFAMVEDLDLERALKKFQEETFPILKRPSGSPKILSNGIAAGYYGMSNIGSLIRASKYVDIKDGKEYPIFDDYLVLKTVKAFKSQFDIDGNTIILFVPPTKHGRLVQNFAERVGRCLNCHVKDYIFKTRQTEEQKKWATAAKKKSAIAGAYDCRDSEAVRGKRVILIDDIWDSGATILEISRMLKNYDVAEIIPLVIAKTVGGDIL